MYLISQRTPHPIAGKMWLAKHEDGWVWVTNKKHSAMFATVSLAIEYCYFLNVRLSEIEIQWLEGKQHEILH